MNITSNQNLGPNILPYVLRICINEFLKISKSTNVSFLLREHLNQFQAHWQAISTYLSIPQQGIPYKLIII